MATDQIQYPGPAIDARQMGEVVLKTELDEEGMVQDVSVVSSSRSPLLDAAAIAAAKASPVYCTPGFASATFQDRITFDLDMKRVNKRIERRALVTREILPWDRRQEGLPANRCFVVSLNQPDYPANAMRSGVEGTLELEVSLDSTGRAAQVAVNSGSGDRELDQAAATALRRSQFGCPASVTQRKMRVNVQFLMAADSVSNEQGAGNTMITKRIGKVFVKFPNQRMSN